MKPASSLFQRDSLPDVKKRDVFLLNLICLGGTSSVSLLILKRLFPLRVWTSQMDWRSLVPGVSQCVLMPDPPSMFWGKSDPLGKSCERCYVLVSSSFRGALSLLSSGNFTLLLDKHLFSSITCWSWG